MVDRFADLELVIKESPVDGTSGLARQGDTTFELPRTSGSLMPTASQVQPWRLVIQVSISSRAGIKWPTSTSIECPGTLLESIRGWGRVVLVE